jgi:hypothetical protein
MSAEMREKRSVPRVQPFVTPCRVVDGERRFAGYVIDLSSQGAKVSCTVEPPGNGSRVTLEVRLGGRAPFFPFAAEVRWVQPPASSGAAHTFGVTFENVAAEQQARLETVLGEFRKLAAALD